jgi:hypothetical protein
MRMFGWLRPKSKPESAPEPAPSLCDACLSGARERGHPTVYVYSNGHIFSPLTTPHLDEWPANEGSRTHCGLLVCGMGRMTAYWMRRG